MNTTEVLFQRGAGHDADMWDDSALIAAWQRQQSFQQPHSDIVANAPPVTESSEASTSQPSRRTEAPVQTALMPPIPDAFDENMKKMVEAWYWAGYWTGFAAAGKRYIIGFRFCFQTTLNVGLFCVFFFESVAMRGNKCVRGGDPSKSRKQRKRDKAERIRKSARGQRQQAKIREIKQRRDKKQSNCHTAALMESFVVRRKAVRAALRKQSAAEKRDENAKVSKPDTTKAPQRSAPVSRALY